MSLRSGLRATPLRGRRIYRISHRVVWDSCSPVLPQRGMPNFYPVAIEDGYPPQPIEMDFTEDAQMPAGYQAWDGDRKRSAPASETYRGVVHKKSRFTGPSPSLLPTPAGPPSVRGTQPMGGPFNRVPRPGFRLPPTHHQLLSDRGDLMGLAPSRHTTGGHSHEHPHGPAWFTNHHVGPPPRGPPSFRFPTVPFNRPAPMAPPMGYYRSSNPHRRGMLLARGGAHSSRGFGGPVRMYRP